MNDRNEASASAPSPVKITQANVDAACAAVEYMVMPGSRLTVCCLTLRNGFQVVGWSACVDPANFNEQKGQQIALDMAKDKVWELEAYLLREQFHQVKVTRELHQAMSGMASAEDQFELVPPAAEPEGPDAHDYVISTNGFGEILYLQHAGNGYRWVPEDQPRMLFASRRLARFFIENNLSPAERPAASVTRNRWILADKQILQAHQQAERVEPLPEAEDATPAPIRIFVRPLSGAPHGDDPDGTTWWVIQLDALEARPLYYSGRPADRDLANSDASLWITRYRGAATAFLGEQEARDQAMYLVADGHVRSGVKVTLVQRA